jgi:AcrR family transcriptional regulator
LFFKHGYQATSLRDIAQAVGIRPASVYHHYPSKQEILFAVLDRTIDELIDRGQRVLMTEVDAPAQLRGITREFILYIAERPREGIMGDTEIQNLDDGNRATLVSKRNHFQRIIEQVVIAGVDQGIFAVNDVKLTVFALIGMCTHVATWFRIGGRKAAEDVASEYGEFALKIVGFDPASRPVAAIDHLSDPAD